MIVIPAIDLKSGHSVRLVEGREETAKVYDQDPVEVACRYEREGARLIHIVDLDGAFRGGASGNGKIIREIISRQSAAVEVGGGVRSIDDLKLWIEAGARYVILGTLAVEQPETVAAAVDLYRDSVVVGIDARDGQVAIRGWTESAGVTATDLARRMADLGVSRIIYTDIARDGRMEGPNIEMTRLVARASAARVTASGGVGSLVDIARLAELQDDGVDSVIVGKALYEGRFTLEQALAVAGRVRDRRQD